METHNLLLQQQLQENPLLTRAATYVRSPALCTTQVSVYTNSCIDMSCTQSVAGLNGRPTCGCIHSITIREWTAVTAVRSILTVANGHKESRSSEGDELNVLVSFPQLLILGRVSWAWPSLICPWVLPICEQSVIMTLTLLQVMLNLSLHFFCECLSEWLPGFKSQAWISTNLYS